MFRNSFLVCIVIIWHDRLPVNIGVGVVVRGTDVQAVFSIIAVLDGETMEGETVMFVSITKKANIIQHKAVDGWAWNPYIKHWSDHWQPSNIAWLNLENLGIFVKSFSIRSYETICVSLQNATTTRKCL